MALLECAAFVLLLLTACDLPNQVGAACRDSWLGDLEEETFEQLTCTKCAYQPFSGFSILRIANSFPPEAPFLLTNGSHNFTANATQPEAVCRQLGAPHCGQWLECCSRAMRCCRTKHRDGGKAGWCPRTWDGVQCWRRVEPGSWATRRCPSYYRAPELVHSSPAARRFCQRNGSWKTNAGGWEKSDYTECLDTSRYQYLLRVSLYVDVAGCALSVVALAVALLILLLCRKMRHDLVARESVQLHTNLFVALLLHAITRIAHDALVLDALAHAGRRSFEAAVDFRNPVWCRALMFLFKFSRCACYLAMFCEGWFLFLRVSRVMVTAERESLLKFFLISWLLPLLIMILYTSVRIALGLNHRCWIGDHHLGVQLILTVPLLLSLACNIFFLLSIEWNLCVKMRTDTSDRRIQVLRQAIRATLSLIPLFGLQFIFVLYRPPYHPHYEIIANLFVSLQGFTVAVLFSFTTKDMRLFCLQLFRSRRHVALDSLHRRPSNERHRTRSRRSRGWPYWRRRRRREDSDTTIRSGSSMVTAVLPGGGSCNSLCLLRTGEIALSDRVDHTEMSPLKEESDQPEASPDGIKEQSACFAQKNQLSEGRDQQKEEQDQEHDEEEEQDEKKEQDQVEEQV